MPPDFLVLFALVAVPVTLMLLGRWTERKGWTRFRGSGRPVLTSAIEGWDRAFRPSLDAAHIYMVADHSEEDHDGKKKRPFFAGVAEGDLSIRALRDTPDDVANFARWLSDDRVLEHYEGRDKPHDEAMVRRVFYEQFPVDEVPCIVEYEGRPIGYLQFCRHDTEAEAALGVGPNSFGMDQFIGEPDCWNRGVGSRMIRLMLAYLFEMEGAKAVTVDPLKKNARAIRAYETCGFVTVKELPQHEMHEGQMHDAWLMVVTPQTLPPSHHPFRLLLDGH